MYEYRAKVTRVIDGDTYVMDVDLGLRTWRKGERVRLLGVDTPEIRGINVDLERGRAATAFVTEWFRASGYTVVIKTHKALKKDGSERTTFERWLAEVFNDAGESLGEALISAGHEK